jgi:hypothetical protein
MIERDDDVVFHNTHSPGRTSSSLIRIRIILCIHYAVYVRIAVGECVTAFLNNVYNKYRNYTYTHVIIRVHCDILPVVLPP